MNEEVKKMLNKLGQQYENSNENNSNGYQNEKIIEKIYLQKLKMLKNHFKNCIELAEVEINEFL